VGQVDFGDIGVTEIGTLEGTVCNARIKFRVHKISMVSDAVGELGAVKTRLVEPAPDKNRLLYLGSIEPCPAQVASAEIDTQKTSGRKVGAGEILAMQVRVFQGSD
jgi:hypothetical protein